MIVSRISSICFIVNYGGRSKEGLQKKAIMEMYLRTVAIFAFFAMPSIAIDCRNNVCTRNGQQQTLCKYTSPYPAAACGKVHSATITQAEKDEIVNRHNELRMYVARGAERQGNPGPQPAAKDMQLLSWDDELAKVAQRWANQCQFGHDSCRNVDRFAVGQNVAKSSSSGTNKGKPSDLIQSWYNEVKNFNKYTISNYQFDMNTGHYSQLVWAKTNKIGCGSVRSNSGAWDDYYLVCNYGPAGNYIGQQVYEIA